MPYTGDDNGDNTYTVKYKLSSAGSYSDWGTNPKAHAASPFTDTITGLTPGETYDVQLTYNDADGVSGTATQTISGIALTHNSTTVGSATAVKASDSSIDVSMPYTGDDNSDNTYTVDYKLSSSGSWANWVTGAGHTVSPYTTTITGLASGTYDVRMTYNDADGVNGTNPQTVTGIALASLSCTVTVSSGGSIQTAITNAGNGDTVCVNEGTYSENLTFDFTPDKNITVIATGAAASTKIQGTGTNAAVVTFSDAGTTTSTVFEGFTIDNQATGNISRGISITNGASPSINNSIVEGHSLNNNSGGGVYISGGSPIFTDTVIRNNAANNTPAVGGGIYSLNASPTFEGCLIQSNSTSNGGVGGGGLYIENGSPIINNSTISSNSAGNRSGGGLYIAGTAAVSITGTTISANTAVNNTYGGGGIYMTGTSLTLSESYVLGNQSAGWNNNSDGGGINIASGTANITNTVVAGNVAQNAGQAGWRRNFYAGTLNLYFSTVADNFANRNGDGLQANGTETVRNSIIWGNYGGINVSGTIETNDNNETASDPIFVNGSQASSGSPTTDGDYHLCNGSGDPAGCTSGPSPCIDTANANNVDTVDIDGDSRNPPYGAGYDKGADEYTP